MAFRETESTEEADEPAEPCVAVDSDMIGLLDNYGRVPAIARERCSYTVGVDAHDAHVVNFGSLSSALSCPQFV